MTTAGAEQFIRIAKRADWMTDAACKGKPADWWFPPKGTNADTYKAKAICATCPVREKCLEWAMETNERTGIYGGVSIDYHRRQVRANRRTGHAVAITFAGSPIAHGTEAGYFMHRRRDEPMCDPCRQAHNEERAERKRRAA
jgi:WhiB family transcriptional regulator, redox-sensing transcriptional regulator